ncbi:hypothetical protein OJAV_G00140390 [Oryzias javanicus]|uniref:Synaptotagmin-like protein 1 n=1 Tax=Oryzias javanicus TaxID=123683 RepID=A0A3S2MP66_ORYJA|nr:hypothetical protein OJAV_G00140390 [Oryzias javanicus]
MIDLSFLTEEEQDCILAVLKRDAELKQTEERRIETLQKTVSDKSQLKFLTGEWFYQTKQLRHQDRIHGSDIIMASMADRRHQPLTIMKASCVLAKSSSFTSCEDTEELFPPGPELRTDGFQSPYEAEKNTQAGLRSPLKKRENPFDDQLALKKQNPQLVDARDDQCLTQEGETKISPDSFISNTSLHKLKTEDNTVKEDAFVPFSALEKTKWSTNSQDGSHDRYTSSAEVHVILKNPSVSSSSMSPCSHLDAQSQEEDKKQESLGHSVMEDMQNLQKQSTQDIQLLPSSEAKDTSAVEISPITGTSPQQSQDGSQEVDLQKHDICHHHNFGDVCEQCYFEPIIPAASSCVSALEEKRPFLAKARSGPDERYVQSPEILISSDVTPGLEQDSESLPQIIPSKKESKSEKDILKREEQMSCVPAKDEIEKKSHKQEVQSTQISQIRSLQLAVLQNRPFKETMTSLDVDNLQEGSKNQAQAIKRRPNLKTSWLTEKTSIDLSSTGQEVKHEAKTKIVHFYSIHKNPNVKDSFSSQTGHQKDTADATKEKDVPSQMETDTVQDDGTYRASPVFIYEEDSLLELKITEPEDSPVPLLVNSSLVLSKPRSTLHEGRSEHFKDKKHTSPEEAFSSSFVKNSPAFSENRETSEEEDVDQINTQECPPSDRSQMSSFKDVEAPEQKMDNESRERSPNFKKLQFQKSKENFDKIRKSPSKTYHPNVLPQESSSAKESRLRESPLKTFPIDIVPTVKVAQESRQKESFSPVRKQREQTNTNVNAALSPSRSKRMKISYSLPLQLDQRSNDNTFETSFGHRRNTNSSISDMSFPSEMNSMSPMSSSLNSICSADVRDTEVQGSIQFALTYIQKLGEFQIFVVLCRGLAVADTKKNRTDPYVKCNLLPDKTKLGKKKTPVKKKTTNPTYNEVLGFKIPMEVLKTQHLNLTVSHKDSFGRSSFLGEVDLDLSVWDFSNTQINQYPLKAKAPVQVLAPSMNSRGEMRVALRFLQQPAQSAGASRIEMGEVHIWVKDCKNLLPVRGSVINPFVKCTVLPDMSSKSRQKTRVVKKTANPLFNHTMVYDGFRPEDLREICVEITVWDQDHLKNYYIGGLRLGLGTGRSYEVDVVWMDSTAHEVNLWNRMLKSGGEWVEEVLPLRFLAGAADSMAK